ncbi:MAG TPA: thioesterase family protein [Solirubrobacteraceae bacterium]|nr:thioesterase family protein [Solirubrobacteraceae bacterium]
MSFYEPVGGGRFASTPHTRGPWDPAFQHAGPPAALLGRAVERCEPRDGFVLARATFEILRAVPVAEVEVAVRVARPGRSVELLEGELTAEGEPVMTVRAWRVLATTAPSVDRDPPPPERPAEPSPPPPGLDGFGYGRAVDLRFAAGGWGQRRPATVWTRLLQPVVPDEEPSGVQRVLAVADSGNGVSAVLSWDEWLFINTELTVHFRRPPRGEWICLDAETSIAAGGAGLARSVLSDDDGVVAQGAQALLVAPR